MSEKVSRADNTDTKECRIPILVDHKKEVDAICGWIKPTAGGILIEFEEGFEPTYDKMQDLFGCAAGHILEHRNGKIKTFLAKSWGYK